MSPSSWITVPRRRVPVLLLLGLALASVGCGKSTGEVSGKVTYHGKALTFGTVTITSANGPQQSATIQPDGTYEIKDVPTGPATVTVACIDPKYQEQIKAQVNKRRGGSLSRTAMPREGLEGLDPKRGSLIPLAYGDFTKTPLKLTVDQGPNNFDIALQDLPDDGKPLGAQP